LEARASVETGGHPAAMFQLHLAEAGLEYLDGRFALSLKTIESAIRIASMASDDTDFRLAQQWRAVVLSALDRFDESVQLTDAAVSDAILNHQGTALHRWSDWRGRNYFQMGRLADAAAILEGSVNPDEADSFVGLQEAATVVALGRIALHTGNRRLTRQTGAVARVMLDQGVPGVRRHAAWLLALQALGQGDTTEAWTRLCVFGHSERKSILPLFPMDTTDEVYLVRIAVASEDYELAETAVSACERRSELNPHVSSIAATAAHAQGLLSGRQQDFSRAVELLEGGPRLLVLASALEDLGASTLISGSAKESVEAFDRALRLYVQAGAGWDAGRLRHRLRGLGVRRRLTSAQHPKRGWAAMTESELAVARLVAEGLTNRAVAERLFVSPYTVGGHLRHIFEKLGVNSRVALTHLVRDQYANPERAT
jgi:DNA-binding CsgD family transcriptional regulator